MASRSGANINTGVALYSGYACAAAKYVPLTRPRTNWQNPGTSGISGLRILHRVEPAAAVAVWD